MARQISEGQSDGQDRKKFHELFPGPQPAWIVGLIDLGTFDDSFNGEVKRKTQVRLDVEFPMCQWTDAEGKQHNYHLGIDINLTWGAFDLNGTPKGNCVWRDLITRLNYGKLPSQEERRTFDYERFLLGKAVMVDTKPSNNGKYTDISSISLPPPGYTFPNPTTTPWIFNFDNYFMPAILEEKRVSSWHMERIKKSFEWQRLMGQSQMPPAQAQAPAPHHPANQAFPQQPMAQPQAPAPIQQPFAQPQQPQQFAGGMAGAQSQPQWGPANATPQAPVQPQQPYPGIPNGFVATPGSDLPGNDLPF